MMQYKIKTHKNNANMMQCKLGKRFRDYFEITMMYLQIDNKLVISLL